MASDGFRYALYDSVKNKWVQLDESSGGYPYLVDDVWQAKLYQSEEAARMYAKIVKSFARDWEIRKLDAELKDIIEIQIDEEPLENYYVTIRSAPNDYRRELRFAATSFSHAEEQCQQHLEGNEKIITIDWDYKE